MILILNIGLKNARCIIFNITGELMADFSQPVKTFINNEKVEQSPDEWWELSVDVIGKAIAHLKNKKNEIKYLTITTSASCLVVLDKNMNPLMNSILVSDVRSVQEANELKEIQQFIELNRKFGINSSPDQMIPKIMWLKKNKSNLFEKAKYFLNISDYLNYLFCGEVLTDTNNATKFYYNVENNQYPDELLNYLNIRSDYLPEVVKPGAYIGNLLPKVANQLKLPAKCKVIMSTYDAISAVAGNGAFNVGDAVDVSGTVTSVRLVSDKKINDHKNRLYSSPHFENKYWLHGGSNNLSGGIIEWTKNVFYDNKPSLYTDLETIIRDTSVCPGGLLFLPYLLGDRTPFWNPECRGVFFGLNRAHTKKHIIKAITEGIGFSISMIFKVFKELELPVKSVTVAGGLSRIDGINQIKSDILNIEIRKYDNFETTAIGSALISLVGVGEYSTLNNAFNAFCSLDKIYSPNQSNHQIYREFSELYTNVYNNLKDSYTTRSRLLKKLKHNNIDELILAENL